MKVVMCCRSCGKAFTKAVTIIAMSDPSALEPKNWKDRHPIVDRGKCARSEKALQGSFVNGIAVFPDIETFIFNIEDVFGIQLSPLPGRTNGCCGLDGCNGKNSVCLCGEHIGTLYTDCWQPSMFSADLETAVWKEVQ